MYIVHLEPTTALSYPTTTPTDIPPLQNQAHLSRFTPGYLFCFEDQWVYLGLLTWAQVRGYLQEHELLTHGYTTEENVFPVPASINHPS